MTKQHTALGVMSGSSLDGVDLALCSFKEEDGSWSYQIIKAETVPYSEEWKQLLAAMPANTAPNLAKYDLLYGRYLGRLCHHFLKENQLFAELIASHGHTIFHNPEEGYTFQLGDGNALARESGIKTISNFRTLNVLWGGQGAPLVPIGDEILFKDLDYCLNLGGIANISFRESGKRMAFDICPANQLLNYLSRKKNLPYDGDGNLARKGKLVPALFDAMNGIPYYKKPIPKSLGNEYVRESFITLFEKYQAPAEDLLFTSVKHIAFQTGKIFDGKKDQQVLVTGGGAHNSFLMAAIRKKTDQKFIIPEDNLTDFKEALIFAFMGVLRNLGRKNCLASYTGAERDLSTGDIFFP